MRRAGIVHEVELVRQLGVVAASLRLEQEERLSQHPRLHLQGELLRKLIPGKPCADLLHECRRQLLTEGDSVSVHRGRRGIDVDAGCIREAHFQVEPFRSRQRQIRLPAQGIELRLADVQRPEQVRIS